MAHERFHDFLGQAKRALVAASREAETLEIPMQELLEVDNNLTAALCSATLAGTLVRQAEDPTFRTNRHEVEDFTRTAGPKRRAS